jgi:hypothetical protein
MSRPSPHVLRKLGELADQGLTPDEMAQPLKMSPQGVRNMMALYGIKPCRPAPMPPMPPRHRLMGGRA